MMNMLRLLQTVSFVAPPHPGIYKAMDDGTEKLFAVQLEQSEKELVYGSSYIIGQTAVTKGQKKENK